MNLSVAKFFALAISCGLLFSLPSKSYANANYCSKHEVKPYLEQARNQQYIDGEVRYSKGGNITKVVIGADVGLAGAVVVVAGAPAAGVGLAVGGVFLLVDGSKKLGRTKDFDRQTQAMATQLCLDAKSNQTA